MSGDQFGWVFVGLVVVFMAAGAGIGERLDDGHGPGCAIPGMLLGLVVGFVVAAVLAQVVLP